MKQTALRDYFNPDLLALVPVDATRVIEVGCGNGAMAREYRRRNPTCEYVGIEVDPVYAEASRFYCNTVLVGSVESLSNDDFQTLFPSSCWIFGDVLEGISLHAERTGAMFGSVEEDDGLLISGPVPKVIPLPVRLETRGGIVNPVAETISSLDWLSQPLSPRALAWTIDALMVTAALLMFALVFLSITGELPASPWTMAVGGAVLVGALYWGFFWVFGGKSFGARLARLVGVAEDESD